MIASLAMYDWPEVGAHLDGIWRVIRDHLRAADIAAPDALSRGSSFWDDWQSPDLCLGQTCGLPYRTRLHGKVELLGAFDQALPGAPPGYYYSHLVVRAGECGSFAEFIGKTLAINGFDSQSGWASAQNEAARLGLSFQRTLHTGAHVESARAVACGQADIAAIDAQSWRLLERYVPQTAGALQIIGQTEPTPGLPLISALGTDAERIRCAIEAALMDADPADLAALDIAGFARIPAEAYLAVPTPGPHSQDPLAG